MSDDTDWLLRPVMAGKCRYESLKDGSLDLLDIAILNEALDVEAENQNRLRNHE
jgi:hypothetical protein